MVSIAKVKSPFIKEATSFPLRELHKYLIDK
jgi:hypothetical protein